MAGDASSVDAVQRFATALREIRGRLPADLFPVTDIADLLAAVRSRRELPREAVTSSGIEYSVHGVGCRMTAPDGRQVDVDLVTGPALGRLGGSIRRVAGPLIPRRSGRGRVQR
jgi:hypothetical protein